MIDRIAVIGAGISGLTVARLLAEKGEIVTVYEADSRPGGLIKCDRVEGSLFHTCGGHVFNTRRQDVLDMFWSLFDREGEFVKADRNSAVMFGAGLTVPYPVENHAYCFDDETLGRVIADVLEMGKSSVEPSSFEEFLRMKFGSTLYELYFKPYNRKVWRRDLSTVPLSWLEGKLPMPTPREIVFNNIRRVEEKKFVHSTFWYEREGGSQLIADRLAEGLDVRCATPVTRLSRTVYGTWMVNGIEFARVVFCGNIRQLPAMMGKDFPAEYTADVEALESHGTTSVFCEIAANPYSWLYLPDEAYDAHRIICTGNFSPSNNAPGRITGTVEFTDEISEWEIRRQLARIPLSPKYITHKYNPCTYPIQDARTRAMIGSLKDVLKQKGVYLTGRFADWEYYNMDAAMGAAMDLVKNL